MGTISEDLEPYRKEIRRAEINLFRYISELISFASNKNRVEDFTEEQLAVINVLINRIDELFAIKKCKTKQVQLTYWNYEGSIDISTREIICMEPQKKELEGKNFKESVIKFLNIFLPLKDVYKKLLSEKDEYAILMEFNEILSSVFGIPIENQIESLSREVCLFMEEIQKYEIARKEIAGTRFRHDEFTDLELELGKYINDKVKNIEQQKKLKEQRLKELKNFCKN